MTEQTITLPGLSDDRLWKPQDVARYLAMSRSWVYQRSATGELPSLNIGGALRFDPAEIKAIGTYAPALPPLVAMGMKIPCAWAHTELGIPEAGEDEPMLRQAPSVTDQVALSSVRATAATAQPVSVSSRDREDQLAQLVATELDPVVAEWVGAIRELVDGAQDLEQIRDGLLALLPNLSVAQFGQAMQHALAIAGAAGMLDALEDSRG